MLLSRYRNMVKQEMDLAHKYVLDKNSIQSKDDSKKQISDL
jgi:hypothetical protein